MKIYNNYYQGILYKWIKKIKIMMVIYNLKKKNGKYVVLFVYPNLKDWAVEIKDTMIKSNCSGIKTI